jgi:hypothetical protein
MYLNARKFLSGYDHSKDEEKQAFKLITEAIGAEDIHDERYATVSVNVAYWRKANHIHHWFVLNVQDGADDCKEYYVTRAQIRELGELCQRVCENGTAEYAQEHLPVATGFFFGSEEYDEYYFEQTDWTSKRLAQVMNSASDEFDFYYTSSW